VASARYANSTHGEDAATRHRRLRHALPNLAIADICTTTVRPYADCAIVDIDFTHIVRTFIDPLPMLSSARAWCFALALALVRADTATEGTPIGSLYAYGTNISGLPVIYSDGKIAWLY